MRWTLVALVVACNQPGPREPGYTSCSPVPVREQCVVWSCYEVLDHNAVEWWIEWGGSVRVDCDGADCSDALAEASFEQCDSALAYGVECRDDCCEICETGQPCDGGCISTSATCAQGPGCACAYAEACG
jgi:hypothetical protein